MGLVEYQGLWQRPDAVEKEVQKDPRYLELIGKYLARRLKTLPKPDARLRLAAWCTQNGLKEQALAHYNAVVRLEPSNETAWKHLGYKKQGSRWVKPEEAAAEKLDAERQRHAELHWKPLLEKLRDGLVCNLPARRERAAGELAAIRDRRAVPEIWRVLASGGERLQHAAVQALGQIDGPSASNGLAMLAVFSPFDAVRRDATTALGRRDPRDVVGRLINLVRRPFKYRVVPGSGPGTNGELVVDGEQFDYRKLYHFPAFDARLSPAVILMLMGTGGLGNPSLPFQNPINSLAGRRPRSAGLAVQGNSLNASAARYSNIASRV
jgi:hypothetical protein